MRILHINTERTWRGGEQQVLYLLTGLARRGVAQALVCQSEAPLAERVAAAALPGLAVLERRMRGEADLGAVMAIRRLTRAGGFDVIHMHTSHAHTLGCLAARLIARRARPRTVVARRVDFSIYRHSFLGLNGLKYRFGVDRYVCVSERIRQVLRADGLREGLLEVVHSGIELDRIDRAPDRRAALREELGVPAGAPLVGNIAALADHKGQRYLIEAWPRVLERFPEARAAIAGEGALRADLEALIARLGLGHRVRLLGFREDVPSLLGAFDAFCFPSHLEGLGTSVLDAMAARLPIVAANAGGIPEMITDGVEGRLVPARDAGALGAALVEVLADPARARALGGSARARVERDFTWQAMVAGTHAVYERLLAARPA